jgi:hypothetical protein
MATGIGKEFIQQSIDLIYAFEDRPAPSDQSTDNANTLAKCLHNFASHEEGITLLSPRYASKLQSATSALIGEKADKVRISWYAEYGCALIIYKSKDGYEEEASIMHIHLICLDEWTTC